MNIIDRIINKRKKDNEGQLDEQPEPCFLKSEIYIYAEELDFPIVKEDKNYIIIGYFNEDKTKFKNLLTGEIYPCVRYAYSLSFLENGEECKDYKIMTTNKFFSDSFGVYEQTVGFGFLKNNYFRNIRYAKSKNKDDGFIPFNKKYLDLYNFMNAKNYDSIQLSDILRIGELLNENAYSSIIKRTQSKIGNKL